MRVVRKCGQGCGAPWRWTARLGRQGETSRPPRLAVALGQEELELGEQVGRVLLQLKRAVLSSGLSVAAVAMAETEESQSSFLFSLSNFFLFSCLSQDKEFKSSGKG